MEKLKVCFGLLLLLVFVVFSFGGMYDYLVFLSSPPGWASMNGGTTGGYGGTEVIVTNINDLIITKKFMLFQKTMITLTTKFFLMNI